MIMKVSVFDGMLLFIMIQDKVLSDSSLGLLYAFSDYSSLKDGIISTNVMNIL